MTLREKIASKVLMLNLRYHNCLEFDESGRSISNFDISKVNIWIPERGELFCAKVLYKIKTHPLEELKEDLEYEITKWKRKNGNNIIKEVVKIVNSKEFIMKFDYDKLKELFYKPIM